MHYRPNNRPEARLGLVVSSKTARRAVDRNYMRRVLRELFQHEQNRVVELDLVIRVQKLFGRQDYAAIKAEFTRLLQKLPIPERASPDRMHDANPDLAD